MTVVEKSEKAINVEGINSDMVESIMSFARRESGQEMNFYEDDVTGYRFAVSPSGTAMSSGVNPKNGKPLLSEGDKSRQFTLKLKEIEKYGKAEEKLEKLQQLELTLKSELAEAEYNVETEVIPAKKAEIEGTRRLIQKYKKRLGLEEEDSSENPTEEESADFGYDPLKDQVNQNI